VWRFFSEVSSSKPNTSIFAEHVPKAQNLNPHPLRDAGMGVVFMWNDTSICYLLVFMYFQNQYTPFEASVPFKINVPFIISVPFKASVRFKIKISVPFKTNVPFNSSIS